MPTTTNAPLFTPSSEKLTAMIANAEAKFEAARLRAVIGGRCQKCGGPNYGTRDQKCEHL